MAAARRSALLALASAALALAAPAAAPAAVIGFDDIGGTSRETVNDRYAAQGVTFDDVTAIDDSAREPGFARSPGRTIETCFAVEFCSAPIGIRFTTTQRSVRVWVGASYPLAEPLPVRLVGLDASGATVATATATLPARAGLTPVRTPLVVQATPARIRRVLVDVPGGGTSGLAVDDVEFSRTGPPPPCGATSVPTVTLATPGASSTVSHDSFLLGGTITTGGAPLTGARITASSAAGPRAASLYGVLVQPTGGTFGQTWMGGLLAPGTNAIAVTATNCKGTSAPALAVVRYDEIPAGTGFRLDGLDVVQTIQGSGNGVPLIAATANGVKRTFARAYLRTTGPSPSIPRITATLTGSRPDGTPLPGPLRVTSMNAITVDGLADVAARRHDGDLSLAFELPAAWLAAGQIHVQIEHILIDGVESHLPCEGCDNPFGNGQPATVTLHATPPLRVMIVSVPYLVPPSRIPIVPSQRHVDMLASWLRRAYPAAEVQISQATLGTLAAPPTSCDDVNARLAEFVALLGAQPAGTKVYGLVDDDGGLHFMRGCAEIGGSIGSGPTGSRPHGWDFDGSYGDWYGGHELGHTFGRLHPGACGESHDDDAFPYPFGALGSFNGDFVGLDVGDPALGIAPSVKSWRAGWTDVMTYCDREWLSAYTYDAILDRLCADAGGCPSLAAARRAPVAAPVRRGLVVTGSLALDTGRVVLGDLYTAADVTPTPAVAGSPYAVVLRDARGRELVRLPFGVRAQSDGAENRAVLRLAVPFAAGARRVEVERAGRVLAARGVSAHAPSVRLLAPRAGARIGRRLVVRFAASDPDGGVLRASVLYAADGRTFVPLASRLRARRLVVDTARLAGSPRARVRVIVTDGVRATAVTSAALRVPVKAPRVRIVARRVVTVPAGASVNLLGQVADALDVRVAPRRLVWRTGRRVLGRGLALSTRLAPGVHVVRLTATNSAGGTATARVRVRVLAPTPALD